MNPTITYDHQATEGNRWDVPVGLFVGRNVKIGHTPVIESLIKNPVFGQ
ncbi:hypothetical protein [Solidesulfovibrio fructosivorans]|nr:hypothetical protein [Solidesulfovibrio fructosivorans]